MEKYILENKKAVKCEDIIKWAKWHTNFKDKIVAKDFIRKVEVSTVFLGVDHSFHHEVPLLFETMVFGGELDQEQRRYTTWEEAEDGHDEMVVRVMKSE